MLYLQRWHGWYVPHKTAAVSAQVQCTLYNNAPCHFMQSHIRMVHACLAVTCQLHFCQNDRNLLRATAVTRGWNGYQNKSQHKKLTLEKSILPPLLTHESSALTTELSPPPGSTTKKVFHEVVVLQRRYFMKLWYSKEGMA